MTIELNLGYMPKNPEVSKGHHVLMVEADGYCQYILGTWNAPDREWNTERGKVREFGGEKVVFNALLPGPRDINKRLFEDEEKKP